MDTRNTTDEEREAENDKLLAVTAMLAERDDDFLPLEHAKSSGTSTDEPLWSATALQVALGYDNEKHFLKVINLAKTVAGKAGISIRDHFIEGDLLTPGQSFTKVAAMLIVFNADGNKRPVAIAQSYFALQCDRQMLEDEKRVRSRADVALEGSKLNGIAKQSGVGDFKKFNGMGVAALYGGLNVRQILAKKGLQPNASHLDFAGSEELAANLFRITQTAAALKREGAIGEHRACVTHERIGNGVRQAILAAGNLPPEQLPAATSSIDRTATQVKRALTAKEKRSPVIAGSSIPDDL